MREVQHPAGALGVRGPRRLDRQPELRDRGTVDDLGDGPSESLARGPIQPEIDPREVAGERRYPRVCRQLGELIGATHEQHHATVGSRCEQLRQQTAAHEPGGARQQEHGVIARRSHGHRPPRPRPDTRASGVNV